MRATFEEAAPSGSKITITVEDDERVITSPAFGTLLRRYRLAAGLSQEALAERARMSKDGISALERGYRRTPQHETLALLAGALALDEEQRCAFDTAAARPERGRQGRASVTIGPWLGAGTSFPPLALTSFIGREADVEEITALVREHRLVTVTGPGGVGKTRIALQVGTMLNEEAERAVCFVALAPVMDAALVVTAAASVLGLQEVPNHPLLETLIAFLKNKTILLILDNCEHVISAARSAAEAMLLNCPGVAILATSREPFKAAGERAYRLRSLDANEAAELFVDRARAVDYRFPLTDENATMVTEICKALDGIPLAIELAAARTNVLSLRALAKRLEDSFQILTGGEHKALPRQQTMRATIEWSYDLLSPREQRILERLSVFAGGCSLAAATAVCAGEDGSEADTLRLVSSLVDKSLLIADVERREPRYWLLESFREYAREKLASRGELEVVARRHALACLALAEQLGRAYDAGPDEIWRLLVREELDNWRAALRWTLTERGDALVGQQLVGRLSLAWRYFARIEGRRWIGLALELVDDRTPAGVLASLSYAEANVAWFLREHRMQLAISETAIVRYRTAGDALGIARAQDVSAAALLSLGHFAEAKTLAEEGLAFARLAGNQVLAASIMLTLGSVSANQGEFAQGR
ncbi:MAG TPA: helix-turn-helix domain-containing protein, partial [Candidatus Cybelea sp.]